MYRVAIIGRPNVGKSTLFNRLTRTRKALVGKESGMTRDRLTQRTEWHDKCFEITDTGGIPPHCQEIISEKILSQAKLALTEAHLTLFVVDARDGIIPLDKDINSLLRSRGAEYLLLVNKVDVPALDPEVLPFYAFGIDTLYPISAEHGYGITSLVEAILAHLPQSGELEKAEEVRVAICGRPNVGKSSLLNRLLGKERAIVTDVPGTTRDSIDTRLSLNGKTYCLIDTAGIRRKGKTQVKTDKLSVVMARKSLEQADVALLVIDAVEGATKLDATIGGYAEKAGTSLILAVNKWDLIGANTHTAHRLEQEFRLQMRFLDFAPMLFVSAKTGQRVIQMLAHAEQAYQARLTRVPTAELNRFLRTEVRTIMPQRGGARRFPVKYAAQVSVSPPTFVFFTRGSRLFHFSTKRFLTNQLRSRYGFYATPVRLLQRPSNA